MCSQVTWQGVTDPREDDWVALLVPGDALLNTTAPAKWLAASSVPTHMEGGAGLLRCALIFRCFACLSALRHPFSINICCDANHFTSQL